MVRHALAILRHSRATQKHACAQRRLIALMSVIVMASALTLSSSAFAEELLVPEDYDTIQEALDVAVSGDDVSVAAGVYEENLEFVADGVRLLSRDPLAATLDGGGSDVVTSVGVEGTVEGFVITNGDVGINASDAEFLVASNLILDTNEGVRLTATNPGMVVNNAILGGTNGVSCIDCIDVDILSNTIRDQEKAVSFSGTSGFVQNNILTDSDVAVHTLNPPSGIAIVDCLALALGFPVAVDTVEASSNLIWDNGADFEVQIVVDDVLGDLVLCDETGTFTTGSNLSADPEIDTIGGYQLLPGSPAIDAGTNDLVPDDLENDIDGNVRVRDDAQTTDTGTGKAPLIDIGAYEFPRGLFDPEFLRGDANADGKVSVADPIYNLESLFLDGPSICLDAQDTNDDGRVDVADPIFNLVFLFTEGADPASPYPDCGDDPTFDLVGCDTVFFCD